jgi:hypothetical protein
MEWDLKELFACCLFGEVMLSVIVWYCLGSVGMKELQRYQPPIVLL